MQLKLVDGLPFVSVHVLSGSKMVEIPDVLIDTGSASTIFAADIMATVGISPVPEDVLHTIRGVGVVEVVFLRRIDEIWLGRKQLTGFEIEVGGMDYGFAINGILGMDFLQSLGVMIDLKQLEIRF